MNRKIIKRVIISFITCLLILFLSSCIGQKELNNLGIINLMGIDLTEDGKYQISVHIIKPSTGQGGQPANAPGPGSAIWIGDAKGDTIQEAVTNLRAKTSWILIWSHCDIFIIGNTLCRQGIKEVLDYLARSFEIRLTSNILTTSKKAWQILKHSSEEKKEPVADQIDGLIKNIQDWSKAYNLKLKDVLSKIATNQVDLVLGNLDLIPASPVKKGQETTDERDSSSKEATELILAMKGGAVFNNDQLTGYLTPEETRGFLRLINEIKLHSMTVTHLNSKINLETYLSKTNIKLISKSYPPRFKIKIEELSRLKEQSSYLDLTSEEVIKELEYQKENAVRKETKELLKKATLLKADILGLKNLISRQDPLLFKKIKNQWDIIFPRITYQIEVKSNITESGKINKPIVKE